ncbi:glycoside hydrolase family 18 [Mucilaginibacter flavus]|uniref:glycoside hydrolase family 18 n=1 Tax=Mucilaginibacter flavus TaxID=931504 RepID=UPI0025B3DB6E|nr:glycoside hydrolase family 18 [Mucilaginibacter flavus]MDN3584277.1 glycoside hydrolase family 18 [Mucilaginibacter flavus]
MEKVFKIYSQMSLMLALVFWLSACQKQNTPTPLTLQKPTVYSNDYYVKLRAYKNSDHARFFIWLADYGVKGGISASLGERFAGVPDSVDIISLWGGIPDSVNNPNDYKEMRFNQRVKGTKLLDVTLVTPDRFASYSQDDNGIKQFALKLVKDVYDNDLDGLDIDYEPNGSIFSSPDNFIKLMVYLSQYVGPKSGTGKLLDIDYYGDIPPAVLAPYVDFVVQQAYGNGSANQLQNNYNALNGYKPGQYFPAETFGDYFATGGVPFTNVDGTVVTSLLGFGLWNPTQGRKGGFGVFYGQRDYYNPAPYGYIRAAIQGCNPAKK